MAQAYREELRNVRNVGGNELIRARVVGAGGFGGANIIEMLVALMTSEAYTHTRTWDSTLAP